MRIFIKCMLIYFLLVSNLWSILLEDGEVKEQNYISIRTWNDSVHPNRLNGHVSLEVVEGGVTQSYAGLHKGTAAGDVFDPNWTNNLDEDSISQGRAPENTVKLFSLNRNFVRDSFDNTKKRIRYHDYGDIFTGQNFSHNSASLVVNLLQDGGVGELFPRNQQSYWSGLWVITKGTLIIGGPLQIPLIYGPSYVSDKSMNSLGTAGEYAFEVTRRAIREARAFTMDDFHEKKYGHPVLAPVCVASLSDRCFETTVHQVTDFMKKARRREIGLYGKTANWK